jgi:hypothetical protein
METIIAAVAAEGRVLVAVIAEVVVMVITLTVTNLPNMEKTNTKIFS